MNQDYQEHKQLAVRAGIDLGPLDWNSSTLAAPPCHLPQAVHHPQFKKLEWKIILPLPGLGVKEVKILPRTCKYFTTYFESKNWTEIKLLNTIYGICTKWPYHTNLDSLLELIKLSGKDERQTPKPLIDTKRLFKFCWHGFEWAEVFLEVFTWIVLASFFSSTPNWAVTIVTYKNFSMLYNYILS